MIKHIVCFKMIDNSPASLEKAKEILLSMTGNVPMLKSIQVGIDVVKSARSYDVVLETVFDSLKDLDDYQHDEYHCSVVKKHMHANVSASIAIDYEF